MNEIIVESSPELKKIKKSGKRLIDFGLLYHEASLAGYSERYQKGETSHTVHVWWARRPHRTMRSLTYATVAKDLSRKSLKIMNNLSLSHNDEAIIEKARSSILKGYTHTPKVLDMFGGGEPFPMKPSTWAWTVIPLIPMNSQFLSKKRTCNIRMILNPII